MTPEYERLRKLGYQTMDELQADLNAGRIRSYGIEELQKAHDLVRALWPEGIRIPQENDVYEALCVTEVSFVACFTAPFSDGGTGTIPVGTQIRMLSGAGEKPIAVACRPLDSKAIEALIIPREIRRKRQYDGYYLVADTLKLNQDFKWLGNWPEEQPRSFWHSLLQLFQKFARPEA